MITAGIVINWPNSDEYIEINLDDLEQLTTITSTLDFWRKQETFVRYNTGSEVKRLHDGAIELTLQYEKQKNSHIDPSDCLWGNTSITLVAGEDSGQAQWRGSDDSSSDGLYSWKRISNGLLKEKKRVVTSRLQRNQARFRNALLACETSCVLTGESSIDALEAAHIIPSKEGGAEVIQNGILLRADIHRLYDAGKFLIDPSGQITYIDDISPTYLKILNAARIPDETIKRTRSALLHQWMKNII